MRERAVVDAATRDSWTFGELLAVGDRSALPEERWVFPRGNGIPFIFEVLRGWLVDAIPTNARGKHARREWRDSYLQTRARATAAPSQCPWTIIGVPPIIGNSPVTVD